MPRGRGRGRGRGGRGGRGGRAAAPQDDTANAASQATPPVRVVVGGSAAPVVTVLATSNRARGGGAGGGRGRGRGRGRQARGGGSGGAVDDGDTALTEAQDVTTAATGSGNAAASPAPLPPSPPVVVVVPQGRMITRSLLRGTSALLLDSAPSETTDRSRRTRSASASPLAPGVASGRAGSSSFSTPTAATAAAAAAARGAVNGGAGGSGSSPSPASPTQTQRVIIGGLLRCVCNAFLVSPSETLLECCQCRNWCHPACVGVDYEELRLRLRQRDFVCPFCATASVLATAVSPAATSTRPASGGRSSGFPDTPLAGVPSPSTTMLAATSITTPLGESIRVVVSPVSAPPPSARTTPPPPPRPFTPPPSAVVTAVNGVAVVAVTSASTSPASPPPRAAAPAAGGGGGTDSLSGFPVVSRQPPAPRQVPLKLREVPDQSPPTVLADDLRRLLGGLEEVARRLGYTVLHLPPHTLTDAQVGECLACCTEAIRDATFSADYPAYCIKEVQLRRHPYVQGIALQSNTDGRVCSLVLSSGRDLYGNLRPTITQLKSSLQRGLLAPTALTPFMSTCMAITDVADFVHITLSATHVHHQRKGLARLLMAMELLKWGLRGRQRAFLNMAIEKRLVDGGSRIEFASPVASKRLYESFGFAEVYPRYDPVTKKERWTAKEADMGRVMANLDFVHDVRGVAARLLESYSGGGGGGGRGASSASPPTARRTERDVENGAEEAGAVVGGSCAARSRAARNSSSNSNNSGSGGGGSSSSAGHARKRGRSGSPTPP